MLGTADDAPRAVSPASHHAITVRLAGVSIIGPMFEALRHHWPEYLTEAAGLGCFMLAACAVGVILEHPSSAVLHALPNPLLRRVLFGLAMGLTAVAIIYSPWGKQSGAHINPCVTLSFYRLGKVYHWDAFFYVAAQFVGGVAGVLLAVALFGMRIAHPAVNYVVTVPGALGPGVAFVAEALISFGLMLVVLVSSNTPRFARFTGIFAGVLVAAYIALEAPLSGMSMNPARTLGSAAVAHLWTGIWIYFTAPLLGMLSAAEAYARVSGAIHCAKLHHDNPRRCIFCEYQERQQARVQRREGAPPKPATAGVRLPP